MSTPMKVIETPFKSARVANRRMFAPARVAPLAVAALALLSFAFIHDGVWLVLSPLALLASGVVAFRQRTPRADTVVLIGRSAIASMIANSLETGHTSPGNAKRRRFTVLRAHTWSEAAALARTARIDEVIVAEPIGPNAIDVTDARGRRPAVVNGVEKLEGVLGRIPVELAAQDRWFTRLSAIRPVSLSYRQTKRALDLLFVLGVGLIVLPVAPLIALAIVLDSRGPVFYSQERVGLGGRPFRIYKFRTMRQDAERNGAVWAAKADPRITRAGKFMRLTRIDELPQIWNVFKGDMTVVGPRPERPEFTAELAREIAGYELRQSVKPGLTGWAQVCYRYTNSVRDTKAKVEYDLYYVKHLSTSMDIRILFRTIKVVLGMKGQ
jgi:exopolysaccharide biosynthesis polyprenyl glycosylphosphotransferase